MIALSGCVSNSGVEPFNAGFTAGAVGDEPKSVLVARDILKAGGSAVDAASAMYATMSVTYPVAAGLGGGGLCLIYDATSKRLESVDFLPRAPISGGPFTVPGTVRGLAAMHGRYGRLPWEQIIGVAERLAHFEATASRALIRHLATVPGGVGRDPSINRIFLRDGVGPVEGQALQQLDLARTFAAIRRRGAGDFYQGSTARRFVISTNEVGGQITIEDMRRYAVKWNKPTQFEVPSSLTRLGGESLILPPLDHVSAKRAAWMWQLLRHAGFDYDLTSSARADIISKASSRAMVMPFTDQSLDFGDVVNVWSQSVPSGAPMPITDTSGATAFAVGDASGQAVSCISTMNGGLGSKVIAPGMGVILTPNVDPNQSDIAFASPMMMVNTNTQQVLMAGGGSGGTPDAVDLIRVVSDIMFGKHLPQDVIVTPRIFNAGRPSVVFAETGLAAAETDVLSKKGQVALVEPFGRLNLIYCPKGMRSEPETCTLHNDPRGFGLNTSDIF